MSALRRAAAHVLVDSVDVPMLGDDADHHLRRVLRIRDGETVTVTDGEGAWCPCVLAAGALEPTGDVERRTRRAVPVTVGVTIPKQDRPEWIVQKLTELGVDRIVLLEADRSVVRWSGDRLDKRLSKLRRVAVEAIQQSRQVFVPVIEGPVRASEFLPGSLVAEPGGRALAGADHTIAVGPEGGWSDDELEVAAGQVALGNTVLRVETAAVVAAALLTAGRP